MAEFRQVGFAVVGLGSIAEVAILPAFAHSANAHLTALVSSSKTKADNLAKKFDTAKTYTYKEIDSCLANPEVEAVYIATPPGERERYAVRAAEAAKHVICEKPLAATVAEGRRIVESCRRNKVQLMTAYRKYYEPSSLMLKAIISRGDLGRIDVMHTLFVEFRPLGDSSPQWLFSSKLCGGGPLMDLGVYCVNTCRWLLGENPIEATASSWVRDQERFKEVEEGVAFQLNFKSGLVLQGTASYGAALSSFVHVHGEKGWMAWSPAFAFEEERMLSGKISGRWFEKRFTVMDEFALELDEFAKCIRENRKPEADGEEGLRDLNIIDSIYRSARNGRPEVIQYG
jgi:predicted dehydrogenase